MNEEMVLRDAIRELVSDPELLEALEDLQMMLDEADQGPTAEASQNMLDAAVRNQVDWIASKLSR